MPDSMPDTTGRPPLWYRFVNMFAKSNQYGFPDEQGTPLKDCTVMVRHRGETSNRYPDGTIIGDEAVTGLRYVDKPRRVDWRTLNTIPEIEIWDYHRDLRLKMLYQENHLESSREGPAHTQEFYLRKLKVTKKLILSGVFWNDHYHDDLPRAKTPPGFALEWTWTPNQPGDVGLRVYPGLFDDPNPPEELFSGGNLVSQPQGSPLDSLTTVATPSNIADLFAGVDRSNPSPVTPGDYIFYGDTYIRNDLWGTEGTIGSETFTFSEDTGVYSQLTWGAKQATLRAEFEEFRDRVGQGSYWLRTDGTVSLFRPNPLNGAVFVPAKAMTADYNARINEVITPEVDVPVKAAIAVNYKSALNVDVISDNDPNPLTIIYGSGEPSTDEGVVGDYFINTDGDGGAALGGIGTSWFGPKTSDGWGDENTTAFPQAVYDAAKKYKDTQGQIYSAIWYDKNLGFGSCAYFFESDSRAVAVMNETFSNPEIPTFIPIGLQYFIPRERDFRIMMGGQPDSRVLESTTTRFWQHHIYNEFHYKKHSLPASWEIGVYLPADANYPLGGAGGEASDDTTRTHQPEGYEPFSRPVRSNPTTTGNSGIYYYPYVNDPTRGRPIFDQVTIPWSDWKGTVYHGDLTRYVNGYYYEVTYELSSAEVLGGEPGSLMPFVPPA